MATYTDATGFAADFDGLIQVDVSGVGHCWRTMDPQDVHPGILGCLADADGEIQDGAEGTLGDCHYRAIAE